MINENSYLISIYCTVYNNARYLNDSIASIINQFKNFDRDFELVIVDNYSTDGTFEILKEIQNSHKNIKLIQEKCSRGKGRAIAYENSSGKFVFTVDLDSEYLKSLSFLVNYALEHYKEKTIFSQILFCSRATMNLIGNWIDANEAEPFEFLARALSKGIELYFVPVFYVKNAIAKDRERRYAGKFFKYLKRGFSYYIDRIRCEGIISRKGLMTNTLKGRILINFAYYYIKFKQIKVYKYSDYLINSFFVHSKIKFLDPKKIGVPSEFLGFYVYTNNMPLNLVSKLESELRKININKKMLIMNKITLFYSDFTSKEYITYLQEFYKTLAGS